MRRRLPPIRAAKGATDLRRYPNARGLVERLLLFLLGRLLGCLLCLLRFLGHVALHYSQKLAHAGRPSTCMHSGYTTILKLIPRASKSVNDGHAVLRPDDALA